MKLLQSLMKFWVLIIAFAFGAFICVINTDPIVMRLPPDLEIRMPLAMSLISGFLYGGTTVIFYFFFDIAKKSLEIRKLQKQLRQYESAAETDASPANEPAPFSGHHASE